MWQNSWVDALVIVSWIGVWALLVYFLPFTASY